MAGKILAYGLGFFKSLLIANYYGTSQDLDTYVLSLAPYGVLSGILLGAVQAVFIPKYLELQEKKGPEFAFAVILTFSCTLLGVAGCVLLMCSWGSPFIARFLGRHFTEPQITMMASLLNISMCLLLLNILNSVGTCLFHAHRQFRLKAFLPLVNAASSLLYIACFWHQGIVSLMYGLIVGMGIETGLTIYIAWRFVPKPVFFLSPIHPEVLNLFKLMMPMILGASFGHVNMLVDQVMASSLPAGSIAALYYARKLHGMIVQLFIIVVSQAAFPFLASQAAENNVSGMKKTFRQTLQRTLYILLPLSASVIVFAPSIVRIFFQRGVFTEKSTLATARAWSAYMLGVPVQAFRHLLLKIYNVLQMNHILMYVAGGSIGLNILLNWVCMKFWGHVGIALSTSLVFTISACILLYILNSRIGNIFESDETAK